MKAQQQISALASSFAACAGLLTALGNETRQHLILEMMQSGRCSGVRVCEITEKTNLSRPAVSYYLQVLKKAGIIKMRKEATKNYYYFELETEDLERLIAMLQLAMKLTGSLPDRSGENEN